MYIGKEYMGYRKILFDKGAKLVLKPLFDNREIDKFYNSYELRVEEIEKATGISIHKARKAKALVNAYFNSNKLKDFTQLKNDAGYSINKHGIIIKTLTRKIVAKYIDDKGYVKVYLNNKNTRFVHVLLANQYIKNPKNLPLVNHVDGDKLNYKLNNLEWMTVAENNAHAMETGLRKIQGEDNGMSKLTISQIKEIRASKTSIKEMSKLYKVSETTIRNIVNRKTWKTIGEDR